jgi:hypothetical protein
VIELVDPRGSSEEHGRRLAPRAGNARAVTRLGFLSNEQEHLTGPHFPGYTRVLEGLFRERLPKVVDYHREIKPVLSRPADADILDRFAGYQGVVNGLAK